MMVNIHTRFGLPTMGTEKVMTHFIYNLIKNDKDDVIARACQRGWTPGKVPSVPNLGAPWGPPFGPEIFRPKAQIKRLALLELKMVGP